MKDFLKEIKELGIIGFLFILVPTGIIVTILLMSIWFVGIGAFQGNMTLIMIGTSIVSVMFLIMILIVGWVIALHTTDGCIIMTMLTLLAVVITPFIIASIFNHINSDYNSKYSDAIEIHKSIDSIDNKE